MALPLLVAASFSPAAGRSQHPAHSASRPIPPISAATRARAQEADASMTRENWEYSFPEATTVTQRLAYTKYFLQ